MATFNEANQARAALKMTLSNYQWYKGSMVECKNGDYSILIHTKKLDDKIRKIIPAVYQDVSIHIDGAKK